jgi:predicted PolB exonuclease-like 3'-5' exonuclease
MNILTFDIETVPDTEGGGRLHELGELPAEDVVRAMHAARRHPNARSEFLPHHLHRIVAISVALRQGENFTVWSLGTPQSTEKELISRFFDGIERYAPNLVSWNGGGFDLPVLHYRSLIHGVTAPRYWDVGEHDREYRWNNYLNRFHWRHVDLMDVLSGYQLRAAAPLDEIAALLGLPGKQGMSGAHVWDAYRAGEIEQIRDYCETDVLNTYLIYLRLELIRGNLSGDDWIRECAKVRDVLRAAGRAHFDRFLQAWTEPL